MCRLPIRRVTIGLIIVIAALTANAGGAFASQPNRPRPNFVFVLIDDLGWADVGCNGSSFYDTPNVNTLAAEGMRFTNGYAACPVCSPTRASIVTGKYPARLKLTNFLVGLRTQKDSPIAPAPYRHELGLDEVTIAEALKGAGYTTCHIGKWHLGGEEYFPQHQGFDINIGGCRSGMPRSFFWPQWKKNPPIVGRRDGEYLPDRLADEAVKFIKANKDKPFFLYLAHYAVHIPIQAKEPMIAKYKAKPKPISGQDNPIYAAMVESIDQSVGRVLKTLELVGIDDRTIIIFTSDNGGLATREGLNTPATCNAPLRGGKGQLYEGGIRVPWIVKWPGVVRAGSTCDVTVSSIDFFPTILEMAGVSGIETNGPIDGMSTVSLLRQTGDLKRDAVYWHYPHFSNQKGRPGAVIRQGDYKLIERYEDGTLELYNLRKDIGETGNLALLMPERAKLLRKRLIKWRESVGANMPLANPDYKPAGVGGR